MPSGPGAPGTDNLSIPCPWRGAMGALGPPSGVCPNRLVSVPTVWCLTVPLWVPWAPTPRVTVEDYPKGYPAGGYTLERLCWGVWVHIPPLFPRVCPPRMAPHIRGSLVGTSQESWENSILDIRVLVPWATCSHGYMFFFQKIDLRRSRFIERV